MEKIIVENSADETHNTFNFTITTSDNGSTWTIINADGKAISGFDVNFNCNHCTGTFNFTFTDSDNWKFDSSSGGTDPNPILPEIVTSLHDSNSRLKLKLSPPTSTDDGSFVFVATAKDGSVVTSPDPGIRLRRSGGPLDESNSSKAKEATEA